MTADEIAELRALAGAATPGPIDVRRFDNDGTYSASRFVSPAPGVMIGAITPEASELIDEILVAWDAHAPNVRPNNDLIGVTTPDRETLYGFVYWLCRWSGLVRPVRTILDDVPSVEWHQQSNGDQYAELDGGWKLLTQQRDDGGYSVTVRRGTDLSASEWHIPYRDSAKRRAVALYAALRGVT